MMKHLIYICFICFLTLKSYSQNNSVWELQNSGTSKHLNVVHFHDKNIGWIVGAYNEIILKTFNSGEHWQNMSFEDLQECDAFSNLFFLDDRLGWICAHISNPSRRGIYKTLDGGANWELLYEIENVHNIMISVAFSRHNNIFCQNKLEFHC